MTLVQDEKKKERLTPEKLAEFRQLAQYGSSLGVGGRVLASLLDEIQSCWDERKADKTEIRTRIDERMLRALQKITALSNTFNSQRNAYAVTLEQIARNAICHVMNKLHEGTIARDGVNCDNGDCWCWEEYAPKPQKSKSLTDRQLVIQTLRTQAEIANILYKMNTTNESRNAAKKLHTELSNLTRALT